MTLQVKPGIRRWAQGGQSLWCAEPATVLVALRPSC